MLDEQQLQEFHDNGFVKGSKALTDKQVEVLREETLRVIDEFGGDSSPTNGKPRPVLIANLKADARNPVWQVVNIWEASPAFEELARRNEGVLAEVVQIMQREMEARQVRLFHDQIVFKPAETGGVNMWHQDSPLWPVLTPKDRQLSAWIALDDVDEENGCMSMVPGSHRWGDQLQFLHTVEDFRALPSSFQGHPVQAVPCPVAKGQIHFHHPLTWHGSPANLSSRPRRAIALHYMSERAVFEPNGVHCMKPFIHVAGGETVQGDHFPLVWQNAE